MPGAWVVLFGVLCCAVATVAVFVIGLSQRISYLQSNWVAPTLRPDGPQIGTKLPAMNGRAELAFDGDEPERLLLFLSASCGPCVALGEKLRAAPAQVRATSRYRDRVAVFVITDVDGRDLYGAIDGVDKVVIHEGGEIMRAFGVNVTPFGLAVDRNGIVRGSSVPNTVGDVEALAAAVQEPALPATTWPQSEATA